MKKFIILIISLFALFGIFNINAFADSSTGQNTDINDVMNYLDQMIQESETGSTAIFSDMPTDTTYKTAITTLYNAGFVKGSNGKVYPDQNLNRYQFGLLIYRILNSNPDYVKNITAGNSIDFTDKYTDDKEFVTATAYLSKYSIMKGYTQNGKKYLAPFANLKGEEVLAVLGRTIYGLKDSTTGNWYDTYKSQFITKGIITKNWAYIGKEIPRKEVFRIIVATLGL